jgi:hypothetical protein
MNRIITYIIMVMLLFTGCAVTDVDKSVDFNQFRKFAWGESEVNVTHPLYKGDLIEKRVKSVVEKEFEKKGIVAVNRDPDFFINYTIFTEKKEQIRNTYNYPFFYGPFGFFPYSIHYWAGPYYSMAGNPNQVTTYTEGTLVLDVVDADSKEVVWRGSVKGNVDNVKTLQKQIDKGVKAILKKYPGKPFDDRPLVLPDKNEVS